MKIKLDLYFIYLRVN